MKSLYLVLGICIMAALAGCANFGETKVSMPYVTEVDRTDQIVEGNQGYLKGTVPSSENMTGKKRPFITIDVDLPRTSKEAGIPDTKIINTSKQDEGIK